MAKRYIENSNNNERRYYFSSIFANDKVVPNRPSKLAPHSSVQEICTKKKYKLLCPRGTQTCALAVANSAHAVREMLDVAKRPIPQG